MTLQYDVNVPVTGTSLTLMYRLKELLVSLSTPWQVRGSSDGDALYEDIDQGTGGNGTGSGGSYDVWTSVTTYTGRVPGSPAHPYSWVRLREPGSTREIIFQRSSTASDSGDDDSRIKISMTGFIGGTPDVNTPPTATDEVYLEGTAASFSSSILPSYTSNYRLHIIAEDTAVNGVYPFYIITVLQGTGIPSSAFIYDAVTEIVPGDLQPWVIHIFNGSTCWNVSSLGTDTSVLQDFANPASYRNYGETDELLSGCPAMQYYASSQIFPGLVGVSSLDNKERFLPVVYGSKINNFYKGVSYLLRWPSLTRGYPNTAGLATTDPYLYIGDVVVPWKQNEIPLT